VRYGPSGVLPRFAVVSFSQLVNVKKVKKPAMSRKTGGSIEWLD
jgi:hypothetical protein